MQPLAGVVVLDLSLNLPGPYATRWLRDLGAEVWKIEPPAGDPAAAMPALYQALNDGKRRLALDLRTEAGQAELHARIRSADVLVEGFRPGVADRLGFGRDIVRSLNPRLVYCSISAFGKDGPLRDLPGHDLNLQALGGACHLGRDGFGRPHGLPLPVADLSAGMAAALQIVAALGRNPGAQLDVALLDTVHDWSATWSGIALGVKAPRPWRRFARWWFDRRGIAALPHYGCFRCRDGRWLALGIVDEDRFWRVLCDDLGLRRWGALSMARRALLGPVLRPLLAARFLVRPRSHWLERLGALGIPVTPVLDPADAAHHPQVARKLPANAGQRGSPPGDVIVGR